MGQPSDLLDLLTAYQTCREPNTLLKALAARLGPALGARAALIWMRDPAGEKLICLAHWFEPGTRFEPAFKPASQDLLQQILKAPRARRISAAEIDTSAFAHLGESDRAKVKTAIYASLVSSNGAAGVVEVLNKGRGDFTAEDATFVEEACRLTSRSLDHLEAIEQEKRSGLATVERLTALYDISRVFNSTLELADLLPVMAEKIRDILGAEACNLWLVDSKVGDLYLAQQAGEDSTTNSINRTLIGEGLIGRVAQQGEARLVENAAEEPLLEARRSSGQENTLRSLMCSPLLKGEQVLGVAEVINKATGEAFDEDDLFFLSSISEQAAIALHNANLLEAERKVHELGALLTTSKELTSTLNLDHVLTTVVHQAATVVPFKVCAIGIFDRSRFVLGAVSGGAEVPRTPEMQQLRKILEWVAEQDDAVSADRRDDVWAFKPDGRRDDLTQFMEQNGYGGFYALPLRDDQGTVGVLALLNEKPDFLSQNHLEILAILASQTTVAIRNARLYQNVPLLSLWQPLLKSKQRLEEISYHRWFELGWKAGLVALALIVVPWKLRIQTNATVVPAQRRIVSAEVPGVIQRILAREGQRVNAGDVVAVLDDSEDRVRLARVSTELGLAVQRFAVAEAKRDGAATRQAGLNIDLRQAEVNLYREKVEKARLRASITGVVLTPKLEEKAGQFLKLGEAFCELVDQDNLAVEMNVPESDVSSIRSGARVALKLNALPTRTIVGTVQRVSPQTVSAEGEQFFVARAVFPNPDGKIRTGMAGQAKITTAGGWFRSGWYPVGYVLLRSPSRWAWRKAWSLLP